MKKHSLKGRNFYILLAAFAALILVLITSAYVICFIALKNTSKELQTSLETILTLQVQNIGESYSSDEYSELEVSLGTNEVLLHLSDQTEIVGGAEAAEAESLLADYESALTYGDLTCYFYFQKSNYLMGTDSADTSVLDEMPDYITQYLNQMDAMEIGASQKYLGTDDTDGYYDVCLTKLAPSYGLIRVNYGLPSYSLPDLFLSGMADVEMYTYDQYGDTHALEEGRSLQTAFDYFSLGEEDSGTFLFTYENHSYIGSYCTFASRPIRLAVFCRDTATENRKISLRIILAAIIILGIACLISAFFFVRWSYRPVDALVSRLEPEEEQDGPFRDDYGILNHTLDLWEEHLKELNNPRSFPSTAQLQSLSNAITSLSTEEALAQYDTVVSQISSLNPDLMSEKSTLFSLLANTVAYSVQSISLPGDISHNMIRSCAETLSASENAVRLRENLQTVLAGLQQTQSSPEAGETFDKIRQFVQDNFRNPDLCAQVVAEQFHISQSTLSKEFKKYNHTGFLAYVHQLRVTYASRLLRETEKPLAEIASLSGYTNVYTMNRAFKTYAHITPGKLRELDRKEKEKGTEEE